MAEGKCKFRKKSQMKEENNSRKRIVFAGIPYLYCLLFMQLDDMRE